VAPDELQYCFEFTALTSLCDGLELTVSGGVLSGLWTRITPFIGCDDFNIPIAGRIDNDHALVWCDAETNPDCPVGFTWGWIIDLPLDGSMTMLQRNGGHWDSWFEDLSYDVTPGPCE